MKIADLKEMPGIDLSVKNGLDSVSTGKVALMPYLSGGPHFRPNTVQAILYKDELPWSVFCYEHGACNKVSPFGIWRCLACNEGAYEVKE